jgi:hypothetical protein
MRKIVLALALLTSVPAMAQYATMSPHLGYRAQHGHHGHHGYWHRGGNGWMWIAPTIIGGVIGYEIARNQPPVVVQQPPVIIQQQPVQVYGTSQNCTPWTETQNADGTITRTRTCAQ